MFQDYFNDRENSGLFHAASEDWSEITCSDKFSEDQFSSARSYVIGAMLSHDPEVIKDAELEVNNVISRFEDSLNGGFFLAADRFWNITAKEKNLGRTGDIFGILMHLYEVSKKDKYLQKALDFLDITLERAWDKKNGGFFSLYDENWQTALDTKDLATQCKMLMHMNGSWKDGMDSPLGPKAAFHKNRAEEFAAMILDKAEDRTHGGFFTSFTRDWKPAKREKDVCHLANLALTMYFHYHNMGPSIWGPRRGSHAFTGRPYSSSYAYVGPAPNLNPVTKNAFIYGGKVVETADILIRHAWDSDFGGFYSSLQESLLPADKSKLISTQTACLMALNVAYRLTGFERFRNRLTEAITTIEDKCFDTENAGIYDSFEQDWTPATTVKLCGPNITIGGIISMMSPVVRGIDVTRQTLALWIDPQVQEIKKDCSARFNITVQNQGFENQSIRSGGLSAPRRWMNPADISFDLSAHEAKSYALTITPPKGMPAGEYLFEITCMKQAEVNEYVSAGGKVIIK